MGGADLVPRRAYLATPAWDRRDRSLTTYERLSQRPGWELRLVQRPHDMMIDNPEELAAYLLEFADTKNLASP